MRSRPFVYADGRFLFATWLIATTLVLAVNAQSDSERLPRDINAVLAAHDEKLLAIRGVVGVYVGRLEDGTTPCLKLMLSRERRPEDEPLPHEIDGYRVVPEVTGEIRPQ